MSIVRLPEYEAEFEPEEFEIYALPRSDANGASPYLGSTIDHWCLLMLF